MLGGYLPDDGGAIKNSGTLTLNNCTITGNTANFNAPCCTDTGRGGGIYNGPSASLTINGCTITNNKAFGGGGIYNDGGDYTIADGGNRPGGPTILVVDDH